MISNIVFLIKLLKFDDLKYIKLDIKMVKIIKTSINHVL